MRSDASAGAASGAAGLHRRVVERLLSAGCVFAEDEADLLLAEATDPQALDRMVAARASGTPLEQVVGWAEFSGLRVAVGPGVFVPRRRTEVLVREAVRLLGPGALVVDVCCGSGAIGAAIAHEVGRIRLHATDVDEAAVRCARTNLEPYDASVHLGDLFDPLPAELRAMVDVVVASPPYVPGHAIATMPAEARDHEPRRALDGGHDGLAVVRRIAASAPGWLAPGGHVLVETSEEQAAGAEQALRGSGLDVRTVHDEDRGGTVVLGTLT